METMNTNSIEKVKKTTSLVAEMKKDSALCKRLFPEWSRPPFQGELQNIIRLAKDHDLDTSEVKNVGEWWLWIRGLMIENMITKQEKEKIWNIGIRSTKAEGSEVIFATNRSPELLHAQIEGQGDKTLPRTKKTLQRLSNLVVTSRKFLPTTAVILFADLAIDNLTQISEVCNVPEVIDKNITMVKTIAAEFDLVGAQVVKISSLETSKGRLCSLISESGSLTTFPEFDSRTQSIVDRAGLESLKSHQRSFGWDEETSKRHNLLIATTMGLVGQAVRELFPQAIMLHNEAFITRGLFNNIFNPKVDPLPVICLTDLLENKAANK